VPSQKEADAIHSMVSAPSAGSLSHGIRRLLGTELAPDVLGDQGIARGVERAGDGLHGGVEAGLVPDRGSASTAIGEVDVRREADAVAHRDHHLLRSLLLVSMLTSVGAGGSAASRLRVDREDLAQGLVDPPDGAVAGVEDTDDVGLQMQRRTVRDARCGSHGAKGR
jgi:hypothetical protein